jgi:hypothetical protein
MLQSLKSKHIENFAKLRENSLEGLLKLCKEFRTTYLATPGGCIGLQK